MLLFSGDHGYLTRNLVLLVCCQQRMKPQDNFTVPGRLFVQPEKQTKFNPNKRNV